MYQFSYINIFMYMKFNRIYQSGMIVIYDLRTSTEHMKFTKVYVGLSMMPFSKLTPVVLS